MLFMVEELMQPNLYTIFKKMNVVNMLTFVVYAQLCNIIKNIQLVTRQKYSNLKNMIKHGMVELNLKSWCQKGYIILYYIKE